MKLFFFQISDKLKSSHSSCYQIYHQVWGEGKKTWKVCSRTEKSVPRFC